MIKGAKTTRALHIVTTHPDGVLSWVVAAGIGCSHATAAGILARLFWLALVDRRKVGQAYVYTPRPPKP